MNVVLVVSGEGRIGRHVRSVLGSQGWWVTTASGREEALRAAADHQPGLVIVDCEIHGAAELVRAFGAKNGGPGVLLLEPPGQGDAFHAFEAGADQILSKPPRAQALLEAAERVFSLPYQSAGGRAAEGGDQLSAADIFGEVLLELEVPKPGVSGAPPIPRSAIAPPVPPASASAEPETAPPPPPVEAAPAPFEFDPQTLGVEVDAIESTRPLEPEPELAEPNSAPALAGEESLLESESRAESRPEPVLLEAPHADDGRFGQYRLDERIAVGGMAEIWRASMLGLEGFRKTVAIKKILPHLAENEEFVTMFIEEAKLAARLSHENLVEIYDLGKIGDSYFIAMEYVDGKDLRGLMNRLRQTSEQMPLGLALFIAAEVARGLEYAHTREDGEGQPLGLVHRDVSPRNVLIGHDGRVRLCDFGVAKAVSSVIQTQIGALKGKLQYMSPEQASGRQVDSRSDIYSLGSVLYEMISGRRIYEEDNEISLLDAARAGNFDDPRKHCPDLSPQVRAILIKALAKRPASRYQSAGALEEDLRGLVRALEPIPDAHSLALFVRQLFAERRGVEEGTATGAAPSIRTTTLAGAAEATRNLRERGPIAASRAARFWWGVLAGLLAAGLGAALLARFSG